MLPLAGNRLDYAARGCREEVELGVFKSHVVNCSYSPVRCSNEGCGEVINKQDQEHHETQVCAFKKLKCDDCEKMVQRTKCKTPGCVKRKEIAETQRNWTEMKDQLNRVLCIQEEMMKEIKGLMSEVKNVKQSVQDLSDINSHFNTGEDIVVAGGFYNMPLASAERFSWIDRKWIPLPRLRKSRSAAIAMVFENQMIVSGWLTASHW